jgi:Flp pilus assembly protein TadD
VVDPNDGRALDNKGVALSRLGYDTQSVAYFDRALNIDPSNKRASNNKGVVLNSLSYYYT